MISEKVKNSSYYEPCECGEIPIYNFVLAELDGIGNALLFCVPETALDRLHSKLEFIAIQSDIKEINKYQEIVVREKDLNNNIFSIYLNGRDILTKLFIYEEQNIFSWQEEILSMPKFKFDNFVSKLSMNHEFSEVVSKLKGKYEKVDISDGKQKAKSSDKTKKEPAKNQKSKKLNGGKFMNFDKMFSSIGCEFGKVEDNSAVYSMYGIAVKSKSNSGEDKFIYYDGNEAVDVTGFVFDSIPVIKVPVNINEIKEKDILIHNGNFVFVKGKNEDGTISVFDISNMEMKNISPLKSPFGVNLCTKIVSAFSMMTSTETNKENNVNVFENIFSSNIQNPFVMKAIMDLFDENDSEDDSSKSSSKNSIFETIMLMNMFSCFKGNTSDK